VEPQRYQRMYTDVAGRVGRLGVQGYLALEGCKHVLRPNVAMDAAQVRRCERTGWGFVVLNVVDEVLVAIRGGGWDVHAHHIVCAAAGALNLGIARRTRSSRLRDEVMRAFMTLLANECVTPSFNVYALLARTGHGRSLGALIAVASSLPMLKFRLVNTLSVLRRVHSRQDVDDGLDGKVFRLTTTVLCALLIALDFVWARWAVVKLRAMARN